MQAIRSLYPLSVAATVTVVLVIALALVLLTTAPARAQENVHPEETLAQHIHLPLVHRLSVPNGKVLVEGVLTLNGLPLANAPFSLQTCPQDSSAAPLRVPAMTDPAGAYAVMMPLDGAASLAVSLLYPGDASPPVRRTINNFQSVCVKSQVQHVFMPPVELEAVELMAPAKGVLLDMPLLFHWESRSQPGANEMYQVVGEILYNCTSCAPVAVRAAALPHPSSSILLECVHASSGSSAVSGRFRLAVVNDAGAGYSEWLQIEFGETVRCQGDP